VRGERSVRGERPILQGRKQRHQCLEQPQDRGL
jgi:hypothetical protein